MMTIDTRRSALVLLALATACVGRTDLGMLEDSGGTATDGGTEGSADASESNSGDTTTTTTGPGTTTATTSGTSTTGEPMGPGPAAVDILFVIDNSGSMGSSQGLIAQSVFELTNVLMQNEISFRIGVTTTDNGNPWCTGTSPEGGALRMSSCRSRQSEFVFMGTQTIDATQEACLDVCALDQIEIEPTTTANDPMAKPRPWVEWSGPGDTNVAGMDPSFVLACALPQGINGCGFEQPLESMYKSIKRAQNEAEASYDFLRDDANLAVIVVSDEVDCSHNPEYQSIFFPVPQGGTEVFWSNPGEGSPTSGVCWNAGVECTGGPGTYDECHAQNFAEDGSLTDNPDTAVLRPIQRYIDLVESVPDFAAGERAKIFAITGAPVGGGAPVYADSPDPIDQTSFGIGPGCTNGDIAARPPVRIREVAAGVNGSLGDGLLSICEASYGPAFAAIGEEIVAWTQG